MIKKKQFPVEEMMCAVCATTVQEILQKQNGVLEASVSYATQKAIIVWDTQKTSAEKLKKVIIDAGYNLRIDVVSFEDKQIQQKKQLDKIKFKFIESLFCSIPVFCIAMFHWHFLYHQWVQMALATICIFTFGNHFFKGAYKQLKNRKMNMDTLVSLSIFTAYFYSISAIVFSDFWLKKGVFPHLYFESVVVIISFVLLGKWLEAKAKGKTFDALTQLLKLTPPKVWLKKETEWFEVPLEEVQPNDVILVKPGQSISVDGNVLSGESFVNESMLTGEPIAVKKQINDKVFAGTINQLGSFEVQVEKVGEETLLAEIIKSVEDALSSKAPIQKTVDFISGIFVPIVVSVAVIALIIWGFFFPENGFWLGIHSFITTLVIACPCALGLATPTAIMVGIGKGATQGILIKNAESLELLSQVNAVVLDKTGTITKGTPTVIHSFLKDKNQYLPILYSLEEKSEHPIAQAMVKFFSEEKTVPISDFQTIVGKGVQGKYNNEIYKVGSISWIYSEIKNTDFLQEKIGNWQNKGTLVGFANTDELLGVFCISDSLKETSVSAISELQKKGIKVYMLTGDSLQNAQKIAKEVGISQIKAEMSPSEKQNFVKELQKNDQIVAMIGDGINDSQALAQAQVSIAMGKGSDMAIEVAQLTIVSSDLRKISKAIQLSKQTTKTIRQNLFWAFVYNFISLPIAAGVLYPFGVLLNPMVAGFAMALSSVSVVCNSLLLARKSL